MIVGSAYPMKNTAMQPDKKISFRRLRWGAVLLGIYWLMMFAGTHLPNLPQASADPLDDKTKHFGAFFGLAALLCFVCRSPARWTRTAAVLAIALGYGIFDELTQTLVPGRHADWRDFVADAAGILTAVVLYTSVALTHRSGRGPEPRWQRY